MQKLFSEFKINNLNLKNRICVPPMVVPLTEDGYVTKEIINRYKTLAKGGPGLIIQEATCISMEGRLSPKQIGIWTDDQIEGLKDIVNAVHSEGSKIFIQIHHAGVTGISEVPLCPSTYEYNNYGKTVVGREMTNEDIKNVQSQFVEASRRAYEAGYDGIELHGCHGYLISQFLNNKVNKRTDVYGNNPEKFVIEILDGIRKVTPEEFIVGIRLGGFEPNLEAGLHYSKILEENGVDFLDISYGFFNELEMNVAEGYKYSNAVYAAEKIKEEVSIPIFAVNGIYSAETAENILEDTKVDLVDVGKGFLINPNWANDAAAGKDTGKCFGCQKCMWFGLNNTCPGKVMFDKNKSA